MITSKNLKILEDYPHYKQGHDKYKQIIDELKIDYPKVIEIGGGKHPLYPCHQNFTVNDIDPNELSFIKNYKTALFDVCGEIPLEHHGKYDLVISKMVLEHLPDGKKYYENLKLLLKKGGIGLTYHPTLYSFPFVVNYLLPEAIGNFIFYLLYKTKNKVKLDDGKMQVDKFKAHYNYCFSTDRNMNKIKKIGFSDVKIIGLYGHHYYTKMPIIQKMHEKITTFLIKKKYNIFSSYAYSLVKK
jgi:SAM-dependent methyltransferase